MPGRAVSAGVLGPLRLLGDGGELLGALKDVPEPLREAIDWLCKRGLASIERSGAEERIRLSPAKVGQAGSVGWVVFGAGTYGNLGVHARLVPVDGQEQAQAVAEGGGRDGRIERGRHRSADLPRAAAQGPRAR